MRCKAAVLALVVLCSLKPHHAVAQFYGNSAPNKINSAFLPRPSAGNKVALVVFEDLGCPACAAAHPLELEAVAQTHVPMLRYDFPIPSHVWTFQGAVCARYLQDRVSPRLADQYRTDVFAAQHRISSKEDLQRFTEFWMRQHGQPMPFVMDPDGKLASEVQADLNLGLKLDLHFTPTIIVVTKDKYQVVCGTETGSDDPKQILPVLQGAVASTRSASTDGRPIHKAK